MGIKQNKVVRFTREILSRPHLVSRSGFAAIESYLKDRNNEILMKPMSDSDEGEDFDGDNGYDSNSGIGVISVKGTLTNEPIETPCGDFGCSYEGLLEQCEEMIEEGASLIILDISSPGGEAFGCFSSSDYFRKMCDDAGVEVIAYVNECADSAAYAWACMANEVICHPQGEVGSIGVLVSLQNYAKAMEMQGIEQTYIYAGDNKIPFEDDGSFKKSFLQDVQDNVDVLYKEFVAHVAKYTGLSEQSITETQASTFRAAKALEMGLVNKVMNKQEFISYISAKKQNNTNGTVDD